MFRAERRYSEVGAEMLHHKHVHNVRDEGTIHGKQRPSGISVPTTCSASLRGTGDDNYTD